MTATRTREAVASTIEATLLSPTTAEDEVRALCAAACAAVVRAVCVPPEHVALARREVGGDLLVVTVAGFPGGDDPTAAKVAGVRDASAAGADEVDVVLDHRALAAGRITDVTADVRAVVDAAHGEGLGVKVILETGALPDDAVTVACGICVATGADWVKTSTGFGPRGASVGDVVRMRGAVGDRARVKAAGGIRTWDDAVALLDAGADALGCSSFADVLDGAP